MTLLIGSYHCLSQAMCVTLTWEDSFLSPRETVVVFLTTFWVWTVLSPDLTLLVLKSSRDSWEAVAMFDLDSNLEDVEKSPAVIDRWWARSSSYKEWVTPFLRMSWSETGSGILSLSSTSRPPLMYSREEVLPDCSLEKLYIFGKTVQTLAIQEKMSITRIKQLEVQCRRWQTLIVTLIVSRMRWSCKDVRGTEWMVKTMNETRKMKTCLRLCC